LVDFATGGFTGTITQTPSSETAPAPAASPTEEPLVDPEARALKSAETSSIVGEVTKPPKVNNLSAIPTTEEAARWDAVDNFNRPYVNSLSDQELDLLGSKVGVPRQGVNDISYREKIIDKTHPDDLLDAIPDTIYPSPVVSGEEGLLNVIAPRVGEKGGIAKAADDLVKGVSGKSKKRPPAAAVAAAEAFKASTAAAAAAAAPASVPTTPPTTQEIVDSIENIAAEVTRETAPAPAPAPAPETLGTGATAPSETI
jgi:hypothetical protein